MNIKTVSISTNYLDLLSYTWPKNKTEIDDFTIITDSQDRETQKFCLNNNINFFATNSLYGDDKSFCKASAFNDFFYNLDSTKAEWILLLDSDIILDGVIDIFKKHYNEKSIDTIVKPSDTSVCTGIPAYIGKNNKKSLNPQIIYKNEDTNQNTDIFINDCLFSCSRKIYNCKNDYENNIFELENCFFYGYFQLFHIDAIKSKLEKKENIFNTYGTAAQYDMDFARDYWSYPQKKTLKYTVTHLGPIASNWTGRKSEQWS